VYDPARDTWSQLPDLPRPRDHFQAVVAAGRLFAIGGRQGDLGTELAETDAYDFAEGTWESNLAPIPTRRGGFAAAALGTDVYVIGGETPEATSSSVEVYDTRRDAWRVADPIPTARHGIQAAVCGGGLFVAAGGETAGGDDPTDAFEVLSPGNEAPCGRLIAAGSSSRLPSGFRTSALGGTDLTNPTSLQFGPDGRLYVAQQNGLVKALTIVRRGAGAYGVTATETIDLVQSIPNHDDDGSSAADFTRAMQELRDRLRR
jgi:hypothetical protein